MASDYNVNLVSGTAQKSAGDRVRLPMDFGNVRQLVDGATVSNGVLSLTTSIIGQDVTCVAAGAPTISGIQKDYQYQISALFAGGDPGTYDVVFSITLSDPDATVVSRTAPLKVY